MGHCQAALLADRAVFRMTGTDARKFLQGMLTNDIGKLSDGQAMHAGLLAPQGKILFELFVVVAKDDFLIDVAKVKMAEEPGLKVAAVWGGSPRLPEGAISYVDPRLAALGSRVLLPASENV